MWFVVVQSITFFGPSYLQDAKNEYDGIINNIAIQPRKAWKEEKCLDDLLNISGPVIGYVLVTQEDGKSSKAKVQAMVEGIRESLKEIIYETPWMDKDLKVEAMYKLDRITTSISLRNMDLDLRQINDFYQNIDIQPDYYSTVLKRELRMKSASLATMFSQNKLEIGKQIEANPDGVGGVYYQYLVHLAISTGIMDFPFYNLGLEAMNFAAIGWVIAHEMGHAFDKLGKTYTWDGRYEPLLPDRFKREYEMREKCFEESYGKCYMSYIDKFVDGRATLAENIADSIGFLAALRAYRNFIRERGVEPFLVNFAFTHEQLFTLALANSWCQNTSLRYMSEIMETDDHTFYQMRINGVMRNSKDFARIWNCPERTPMNPPKKCSIFS